MSLSKVSFIFQLVSEISRDDSGDFTCVASNSAGHDELTYPVQVLGEYFMTVISHLSALFSTFLCTERDLDHRES